MSPTVAGIKVMSPTVAGITVMSPTVAGIKVMSLYCCSYQSDVSVLLQVSK